MQEKIAFRQRLSHLIALASEKEEPGKTAPRTESILERVCGYFYLQLKRTLVNNMVFQVHSPTSASAGAHVVFQDNSHGILIIFLSFLCCFTKILLTSRVESAGIKRTPDASIQHYDSSVLICSKELSTTGFIKVIILKAFTAYAGLFYAPFY